MLRLPFLVISLCAQMVAQTSDTRLTMNLDGVSVESALRSIARQANLQLAVKKSVLPKKLVSLKLEQTSVSQALSHVLAGTGLVADINKSGILTVTEVDVKASRRGGQGVITGKVVDTKTGKGIAGANVLLDHDTRGAVSDESGVYRIADVPVGSHTVVVRLVGYAKQTRPALVGENAVITVDFKLEPSASVLDQVVVTGTIVSTEMKAVPNAITVITAKQIEERGITRIDQLFRGDIPGLFSLNMGSNAPLNEVTMFSRGATALSSNSTGTSNGTNPIKTYIDGIEMADSKYLSQVDPSSIERIEILTGPQASTIYGSNAINGVMQIFTKRGSSKRPQLNLNFNSGIAQNNFSSRLAPDHLFDARATGIESRWSYNIGGSWNYEGSWTPGKQSQRVNISGGARMDFGKSTMDVSARQGITQTRQHGSVSQGQTGLRATGILSPGSSAFQGLPTPKISTLNGHTLGLSFSYRPISWWSHGLKFGTDASATEIAKTAPGFSSRNDTLLQSGTNSVKTRISQSYNTTLQLVVSSIAKLDLTLGTDHWRTKGSSWFSQSRLLIGSLPSASFSRTKSGKNSGAFIQGQLGIFDNVFLTYGVRSDWNPSFGDKARVLPGRYGVSVRHDIGPVSAKLRGSYGRSIRPPDDGFKFATAVFDPSLISQFGQFNVGLANPELSPEDQRGGEGGIEIYIGNRASIVITRYNQTVDNLIFLVQPVDSVRSLVPVAPSTINCAGQNGVATFDPEGHCFWYQSEYLNVGSIRNQGWETQGSINIGPLTARATYSWTKSRILGITPKYRALVFSPGTGLAFQVGRPFDYMPEHTWALGLNYSHAASTVSLSINGLGMRYIDTDALSLVVNSGGRILSNRPRMDMPVGYRSLGSGYVTSDLNAMHSFSSRAEAVLQVANLTNYYQNDLSSEYATIGRQTRLGLRWRIN